MPHRGVPLRIRLRLYLACNGRCVACRKKVSLPKMHADHIHERSADGDDTIENLRLLCEDCHKFRHGWFGWIQKKKPPLDGWSVFEVRKKLPNQAALKYLKLKGDHFRIRVRPHWMLEMLLKCGCRIEVRQYLRPPYTAVRYKYPDMLALCPGHSPKSPQHWPTPNDVMPRKAWSKLRPKIFRGREWERVRARLAIFVTARHDLSPH